jgi:predicted TIM-barrel fold metal-dependent hydrolase
MNRRKVLRIAAIAGASSAVLPAMGPAGDEDRRMHCIIDTNVSLFHWPFRRLPLGDTNALVKKLRSLGISQAWAGSFEGILHRDIAGVNHRLAEACSRFEELKPFGSINPSLPDWENDLGLCIDEHHMPGIRLHPNYHGYTLEDPRVSRLFERAVEGGLLIQIATEMEDPRTQNLMLQVPAVDLAPVSELMMAHAGARVQILNHNARSQLLKRLAAAPGIYFDTARVESTDGVPTLVNSLPPGRVLFGSHAPFLIPEASLIRVHESGILEDTGLSAVLSENAMFAAGKGAA